VNDFNVEGYEPLFELGLYKEESPCCRVIPSEISLCPIVLASLVTALLETAMSGVPEKEQIDFEEKFHKALQIMLEERFEYDVITKYPDDYE
jgi:hypothetical protein